MSSVGEGDRTRSASTAFGGVDARTLAVAVSCVAVFVTVLDAVALSLTAPLLALDLGVPVHQVSWAGTAYGVTLIAWLPVAAAITARRGHRAGLIAGLTGFAVTSAVCALATSTTVLIGARAMQGLAAALLAVAAFAGLTAARPAFSPARVITLLAGTAAAAAILGPAVGAGLVDAAGWRAVFAVNVPVCVALLVAATVAGAGGQVRAHGPRPDYAGALLGSGAIASVAVAASSARLWPGPLSWLIALIGLFALGVVALRALPPGRFGWSRGGLPGVGVVASVIAVMAGVGTCGYLLAASLLMIRPGEVTWVEATGCAGAVAATGLLTVVLAGRYPQLAGAGTRVVAGVAATAAGVALVYSEVVGVAPQVWAWTAAVLLVGAGIAAAATSLALLLGRTDAAGSSGRGGAGALAGQLCGAAGTAGVGAALSGAQALGTAFPFWSIMAATAVAGGVVLALAASARPDAGTGR